MSSTFFSTLARCAGTRQQENQLSSTFKACFDESLSFRRAVLRLLWATCGLKGKPPLALNWACRVEVPPPTGEPGRVDIVIRVDGHKDGPVFWLENKVAAPLTRAQLLKYRTVRAGSHHLIAVTKRHPEVSPITVGARALRWQSLHGAVALGPANSQRERFIRSAFCAYLEDLGMAHPEQITTEQLRRFRLMWRAMRQEVPYAAVRDGFATADALGQLLEDVRVRVAEARPRLVDWRRSGPNIGSLSEEGVDWITVSLYDGTWAKARILFGLAFPHQVSKPAIMDATLDGQAVAYEYEAIPISRVLTRGALDVDKMTAFALRLVRKWKL